MPKPPARPPRGITWPITDKATGERSSTVTGKEIWAAAWEPLNPEIAEKVRSERKWRFKYARYVVDHVRSSLLNPDRCLDAARAGLDAAYDQFEFVRDGKTCKLREAMELYGKGVKFETGHIKGDKKKPQGQQFSVPYKGENLTGERLKAQLREWEAYGTIEKDCADALARVADKGEWVDLSDMYFVLLGAGSAMGPFLTLLSLGANIIAVDLDRKPIWDKLIKATRESPGTLTFALSKPQEELKTDDDLAAHAGGDLIAQAPEICAWLLQLYPDKPLHVGAYVYLDGALHVQVYLGCDLIMKELSLRRTVGKQPSTSLAYLCTPTDCHVTNADASQAASDNYSLGKLANLLVLPLRMLPNWLTPNMEKPVTGEDGTVYHYVDGLSVAQGPNYATAKRLQHWRAIEARSRGCTVVSNVAPSTATASVVHNRQFAWAYDGMPYFKPMEIFQQDTSNAVMAGLLLHDLRNTQSAAHASTHLSNPLELFSKTSFHGGVWRCGYKLDTIGETSVLIHFIKVLRPLLALMLLAFLYFKVLN